MNITVTEAKGLLTDLVRRAEAGEDIVLTRHGTPAARLVAVAARQDFAQAAPRAGGFAEAAPNPFAFTPGADRAWDDFFDAPGIDLAPRDQPQAQQRDTF